MYNIINLKAQSLTQSMHSMQLVSMLVWHPSQTFLPLSSKKKFEIYLTKITKIQDEICLKWFTTFYVYIYVNNYVQIKPKKNKPENVNLKLN